MHDPHANCQILQAGAPLEQATAALILIHGRGATADSILDLANHIGHEGFAYLAPQASGNTWYPYSFLEPIHKNEPFLTSALACIERTIHQTKLERNKIAIAGFSQGACLTAEYAVRNPAMYGALLILSGGVIGPPGTKWDISGSLDQTPVFIGCSDVDPHIPLQRVHETTAIFRELNAAAEERIYRRMAHTINEDEINSCKEILAKV